MPVVNLGIDSVCQRVFSGRKSIRVGCVVEGCTAGIYVIRIEQQPRSTRLCRSILEVFNLGVCERFVYDGY